MSDLLINLDEFQRKGAALSADLVAAIEKQFQKFADELRLLKAANEDGETMNDQLLKKDQLAEKLQVSISTVSKMQTEGLPVVPCGTAVRFDYPEVKEWLKSRRANKCGKVPAERVRISVRTQSSSNGKSQMEAQNGSI